MKAIKLSPIRLEPEPTLAVRNALLNAAERVQEPWGTLTNGADQHEFCARMVAYWSANAALISGQTGQKPQTQGARG